MMSLVTIYQINQRMNHRNFLGLVFCKLLVPGESILRFIVAPCSEEVHSRICHLDHMEVSQRTL